MTNKKQEENENLRVWHCMKCGYIIKQKDEPNECSCGHNEWYIDTQAMNLLKNERRRCVEMFKKILDCWFQKCDDNDKYDKFDDGYAFITEDDIKELKQQL